MILQCNHNELIHYDCLSEFKIKMNDNGREIHFGSGFPTLRSYRKLFWEPNVTRLVEFFPNKLVSVTLLYSNDPELFTKLSTLIDGNPISIDLEWAPDYIDNPNIIELFQFASSKGVIVVATINNQGYNNICNFLQTSQFYGKGTSSDIKRLYHATGINFDIEDIEKTRMIANNLTINFEAIVKQFAGDSCAQFKDHKTQRSNWNIRPLSILQVLYGAHDAHAMYIVYNEIIKIYGKEIKPEPVKSTPSKTPKIRLFKALPIKYLDHLPDLSGLQPVYKEKTEVPLKQALFRLMRKTDKTISLPDDCFEKYPEEIMNVILKGKSKESKISIIKQFQIALDMILYGIVKYNGIVFACLSCERHFHEFYVLSQHCWDRHHPEVEEKFACNFPLMLMNYLLITKKVNCLPNFTHRAELIQNKDLPEDDYDEEEEERERIVVRPLSFNEGEGLKCYICDIQFNTFDELKIHCWHEHHDMLFGLFKEITQPKNNEQYHELGVLCINKLGMGDVDVNQMITCKICTQKISDPPKFFMHLFYKHLNCYITKREFFEKWELSPKNFMDKENKHIAETYKVFDIDTFKAKGLLDPQNHLKCQDCKCEFLSEEALKNHLLLSHCVFLPQK